MFGTTTGPRDLLAQQTWEMSKPKNMLIINTSLKLRQTHRVVLTIIIYDTGFCLHHDFSWKCSSKHTVECLIARLLSWVVSFCISSPQDFCFVFLFCFPTRFPLLVCCMNNKKKALNTLTQLETERREVGLEALGLGTETTFVYKPLTRLDLRRFF